MTGSIQDAAASAAVLLAFAAFVVAGGALAVIDARTHRLPNAIVLPAYPVAAILLTAAALLSGDPPRLVVAATGMVALFAFYLLLRLVRPAAMGGGDVKLAGLIGLHLGWLGWSELLVGSVAAFLLAGVFGVVLLATGRAGRSTAIAFGPWMILGAWAAILLALLGRAGGQT